MTTENFTLVIVPSPPTTLGNDDRKGLLKRHAKSAHSQFPQYDGHWDGPEWVLVKVTRRVRTKLGVAFEKGDVTLARPNEPVTDPGLSPATLAELNKPGWTAYSVRNSINTALSAKAVKVI